MFTTYCYTHSMWHQYHPYQPNQTLNQRRSLPLYIPHILWLQISEIPNLPTITSIIFSIKRLDPHHYSNTQPSLSMFIISLFSLPLSLKTPHFPATRYFLFYFSFSIFSLSLDSSFPTKHQPFSTFPYVIPF